MQPHAPTEAGLRARFGEQLEPLGAEAAERVR